MRGKSGWGWEGVTIGITGAVCIIVGIADLLGLLGASALGGREPVLSLVVLGMLAGYLSVERKSLINEIKTVASRFEEASKSHEQAIARVDSILQGMASDRFSELKLIYGLRGLGEFVSSNTISVGTDHVFDLWRDSIREARTVVAYNHVSSEEVWGTKGWAFRVAHAVQQERIKVGASIGRVFIVSDQDEIDLLGDLMKEQKRIGIDVRWVSKDEIQDNPTVVSNIDAIETWDYVVVDEELLFRVDIDENRKIVGCRLTQDRELCKKARLIYDEVYQRSHRV